MDRFSVIRGDSLDVLPKLIRNKVKVDGVITSPVYNLGKNPFHWKKGEKMDALYDQVEDNVTEESWLDHQIKMFNHYDELVHDEGVVIYVLSYSSKNASLPEKLVVKVEEETRWCKREMVVWKKAHSIPFQTSPRNLSRICETIYVFARKGVDFKTNKEVSSVNGKTGQSFYYKIDNFIEAGNSDKHKGVKHNATFSVELVKKIITIYFPEGSVILDPYMGLGTTGAACIEMDRRFFGIDISTNYYEYALEWLQKLRKDKELEEWIANICEETHYPGELEKCEKNHIEHIEDHDHNPVHVANHPRFGFSIYVCDDDNCQYSERR